MELPRRYPQATRSNFTAVDRRHGKEKCMAWALEPDYRQREREVEYYYILLLNLAAFHAFPLMS
jgi:hypothetical protein